MTREYCDACDGCGWTEGGASLQTGCARCGGTGIVAKPCEVASCNTAGAFSCTRARGHAGPCAAVPVEAPPCLDLTAGQFTREELTARGLSVDAADELVAFAHRLLAKPRAALASPGRAETDGDDYRQNDAWKAGWEAGYEEAKRLAALTVPPHREARDVTACKRVGGRCECGFPAMPCESVYEDPAVPDSGERLREAGLQRLRDAVAREEAAAKNTPRDPKDPAHAEWLARALVVSSVAREYVAALVSPATEEPDDR